LRRAETGTSSYGNWYRYDEAMARILIDTNVLVGAAYNSNSASRKIVSAVEAGTLQLIVSPAIVREYKAVLPKAIHSQDAGRWVWQAIDRAESVTPSDVPSVTEDRSDDKFLAAALAGKAEAIVTSDEHLLAVHPYARIAILQPTEFWKRLNATDE